MKCAYDNLDIAKTAPPDDANKKHFGKAQKVHSDTMLGDKKGNEMLDPN